MLLAVFALLLCIVQSALSCGYPGAPAHCLVSFSEDVLGPGTVATYECESGFELLGPARRTCQPNATWTPQVIPFCVLNVGVGKAPMQSSIGKGGFPQKAVDGSTSAFFSDATCSQTEVERAPWWYVNLLEPYMIQLVRIDFGKPCCGNNQPATIIVRVGNNRPDARANPICGKYTGSIEEGKPLFIPCSPGLPGAFVSIHMETSRGGVLSICEAFLYTDQALPTESCPSFRDQPLGSTATYNGRCYIFYNNHPLTMEGAKSRCESQGGTLVDETSPALQGFLSWELWRRHRNADSGQYWMGAVRDPKDPNNWKWINGNDVSISFWNLPGGNDNCSRFDGTQRWLWSDTNCNLNLNYICQFRPNRCGIPERPPNSTILTTDDFTAGTLVEYLCAPGHILIGSHTRTCLPSGYYTESVPQCKYLECGFPTDIANGGYTLVNGSRHYQSVVRYFCDDGYILMGRETLACDVQKSWDGPPPRCEPTKCPQPASIAFGSYRLINNATTFGMSLEYFCDLPGYRLIGPSRLRCGVDGHWDSEPPVCQGSPVEEITTISTTSTTKSTTTTTSTSTTPSTPVTEAAYNHQPSANLQPAIHEETIPSREVVVAAVEDEPSTTRRNRYRGSTTTTTPPHYIRPYFPDPEKEESPKPTTKQTTTFIPTVFTNPPLPVTTSTFIPPTTTTTIRRTTTTTTTPTTTSTTTTTTTTETPYTNPTQKYIPHVNSREPPVNTREPEILTFTLRPPSTILIPTRPIQSNDNFLPLPTNERPVFSNPPPRPTAGVDVEQQPTPIRPTSAVKPTEGRGGNSVFKANTPEMEVRESERSNTRLNIAGIIALSVSGGLLFLGAAIVIIIVFCRRSRSTNGSLDNTTISTNDSLSSESRGLNKYYKRAWENLRSESKSTSSFSSGLHRNGVGIEGLRDTNEMTVNDATTWNTKSEHTSKDPRRHHHHHHHHHHNGHHVRSDSPDSVEGTGNAWNQANKSRRH